MQLFFSALIRFWQPMVKKHMLMIFTMFATYSPEQKSYRKTPVNYGLKNSVYEYLKAMAPQKPVRSYPRIPPWKTKPDRLAALCPAWSTGWNRYLEFKMQASCTLQVQISWQDIFYHTTRGNCVPQNPFMAKGGMTPGILFTWIRKVISASAAAANVLPKSAARWFH